MGTIQRVVDSAYYRNPRGVGVDPSALIIRTTADEVFHVPNTGFQLGNPTLQLLAALGKKPSDGPSSLEGESLFVTYKGEKGEYVPTIHKRMFVHGAQMLEESDWFDGGAETTEIEVK